MNGLGTSQDTNDFVLLCESEIQYLLQHPLPEGRGPSVMTVSRKFTDVFLECGQVYGPTGLGTWTMDLAIKTLNTIRGLVEANGMREYKFEVRREDEMKWMVCRIWKHNPYSKPPDLAATKGIT